MPSSVNSVGCRSPSLAIPSLTLGPLNPGTEGDQPMNNCMLLAEIVQAPQLRYTSDTQTPVAEFVVQFPGLREGDPASQMKVVGWGNLAQDIQAQYQAGQRVLLEGRLAMNVVEH